MRFFIIIFLSLISFHANAQKTLDDLLQQYNPSHEPYVSVQELAMPKNNAVILDAREPEEFAVSHLKNAILVGYNHFTIDAVQKKIPDKNKKIVVYCSVGIRSDNIARKLKKAGYINVYNLYGGIFEWKNEGFPVFNSNGNETDDVHAFSKTWGKWLLKGHKVYDATLNKI